MPALDPDWTDPCAVLAWLRPQYYKVAAGGQSILVRYRDYETRYGPITDTAALTALMARLESDCAAKQGLRTGRRRAFTFG